MIDQPTPPEVAPRVQPISYRWGYLAPEYRDDPSAVMFDTYLDLHCRWSPEDGTEAGIPWLWAEPIPARLDWWGVVDKLNVRLHNLEREARQ